MAEVDVGERELAILFDNVHACFDNAAAELTRLSAALSADRACRFDLLFLPPSSLVCRLRLQGAGGGGRLTLAQTSYYRVLNLGALSPAEQKRFFDSRLLRSTWSALDVDDPTEALEELRGEIGAAAGGDRREIDRVELALPVRAVFEHITLIGMARDISSQGVYIECEASPEIGASLRLSFETTVGHAPADLEARVVFRQDEDEAALHDRGPGFGAEFTLAPDRQAALESFLVAAARGRPWPERSGRRHGRYDLGLRAAFAWDGRTQDVETGNVSRGGVLLRSSSPPPVGSELRLILYHPRGAARVKLRGEVMRAAGERGEAGVRFAEAPSEVEKKLRVLVGGMRVRPACTAMVVDADSFFRTVLGNILRPSGFEIIEAADADAAFTHVLDMLMRIDLVVVDLFAGGMGVRALAERLVDLAGPSRPAVAVMTEQLEEANVEALERLGVDAVLAKVTPAGELLERLEALVEERAAGRAEQSA